MIDHLSLGVADLARAVAFYDAIFAPLGATRLWATGRGAGWGAAGGLGDEPFAVFAAGPQPPGAGHVAFTAPSRRAVDEFHAAALRTGGSDEGAPGPRPQYGAGYYAAFVRDPDGHRLEAVCHER